MQSCLRTLCRLAIISQTSVSSHIGRRIMHASWLSTSSSRKWCMWMSFIHCDKNAWKYSSNNPLKKHSDYRGVSLSQNGHFVLGWTPPIHNMSSIQPLLKGFYPQNEFEFQQLQSCVSNHVPSKMLHHVEICLVVRLHVRRKQYFTLTFRQGCHIFFCGTPNVFSLSIWCGLTQYEPW